jgi:hypothetical protein
MKRLMLLVVVVMMLFSTVAEAGFGSSFWGGFFGSSVANSLSQPPAPTVVVVQPQQALPPTVNGFAPLPNSTIIGKITGIQGNNINPTSFALTLQDGQGRTYNFTTYSSTQNFMNKPIELNDYVEISPTGSRFDMIDWIKIASPVAANSSSGNGGAVDDVETRLKKAKSLREQGLISDEEYNAARQRILNDL